mgnify:CR=1 FL=1
MYELFEEFDRIIDKFYDDAKEFEEKMKNKGE